MTMTLNMKINQLLRKEALKKRIVEQTKQLDSTQN